MSVEELKPLVSIIINNYNYANFLPQAIESTLAQSYPLLEVIVVDDGSTDSSVEIIKSYGEQVTPIFKQNGGQASTMNIGFYLSKGEIITFLDADDYLFPTAIEEIVAAWKPETAQLQARLELVDINGKYIDLHPAPEIKFDTGNVCLLLLQRGRYNTTVTSGNSFSRIALEQVLPIPEKDFRISADGYLVTTVPFFGNVTALEKPIGGRRKHGGNHWANSEKNLKAEQFCRSLEHDFLRYKYLEKIASSLGYKVSPNPGLRDYLHVTDRLVSLRLDAQSHPISTDTETALTAQGVISIWKYSSFNTKRKIILCLWFLWVGLLPLDWAKAGIAWKFLGKSRPPVIDHLLKRVRTATS